MPLVKPWGSTHGHSLLATEPAARSWHISFAHLHQFCPGLQQDQCPVAKCWGVWQLWDWWRMIPPLIPRTASWLMKRGDVPQRGRTGEKGSTSRRRGAHTACSGHLLTATLTPHLLHHRLGELQPVLKGRRGGLMQLSNKGFELPLGVWGKQGWQQMDWKVLCQRDLQAHGVQSFPQHRQVTT